MEVSVLVSILGPCLGVLLTGVNAVAQEIGKSVAPELLEHAKRLWAKLRPHVESKPAALEAATDLAERPDDVRARASLELQLESSSASIQTWSRKSRPSSKMLSQPASWPRATVGQSGHPSQSAGSPASKISNQSRSGSPSNQRGNANQSGTNGGGGPLGTKTLSVSVSGSGSVTIDPGHGTCSQSCHVVVKAGSALRLVSTLSLTHN